MSKAYLVIAVLITLNTQAIFCPQPTRKRQKTGAVEVLLASEDRSSWVPFPVPLPKKAYWNIESMLFGKDELPAPFQTIYSTDLVEQTLRQAAQLRPICRWTDTRFSQGLLSLLAQHRISLNNVDIRSGSALHRAGFDGNVSRLSLALQAGLKPLSGDLLLRQPLLFWVLAKRSLKGMHNVEKDDLNSFHFMIKSFLEKRSTDDGWTAWCKVREQVVFALLQPLSVADRKNRFEKIEKSRFVDRAFFSYLRSLESSVSKLLQEKKHE